jgi:hypothetical protein
MNVNFTVTSVLDPGYSALAAVKGAIRAVLYQGAGKYFWRHVILRRLIRSISLITLELFSDNPRGTAVASLRNRIKASFNRSE